MDFCTFPLCMMCSQKCFIKRYLANLPRHICIGTEWHCFMTHHDWIYNMHIIFLWVLLFMSWHFWEYTSNLIISHLVFVCVYMLWSLPIQNPFNSLHIFMHSPYTAPLSCCVFYREDATVQCHTVQIHPLTLCETIFDILLLSFDWFSAHHKRRHPFFEERC